MTYTLRTGDGQTVLNKHGFPFVYSSRELALIGRRVLAKHLGKHLAISE